jgi:hypothetical protein
MPEGRRPCGLEVAGGRWQSDWATIDLRQSSRTDMHPKPYFDQWTLVMAIKIRRFDTG